MANVSASLLSADLNKLAYEIERVEKMGVKYIHCDVMDGKFVNNTTYTHEMVKKISENTNSVVDVHLMILDPQLFIQDYIDAGADIITFHHQGDDAKTKEAITIIKKANLKVGIALNPNEEIDFIEKFLDDIDLILVMGVWPGFGGQKLIEECVKKVERIKDICNKKGIIIEFDGGVNISNVEQILKAGVELMVAGSAVYGVSNPEEFINKVIKF